MTGHTQIISSCYYKKSIKGENVIIRHAFAYQISGSLVVQDGIEKVIFQNPKKFLAQSPNFKIA